MIMDNVQNINLDSCSRTVHLFTSGPIYAGHSLIKRSWKRLRTEKLLSLARIQVSTLLPELVDSTAESQET